MFLTHYLRYYLYSGPSTPLCLLSVTLLRPVPSRVPPPAFTRPGTSYLPLIEPFPGKYPSSFLVSPSVFRYLKSSGLSMFIKSLGPSSSINYRSTHSYYSLMCLLRGYVSKIRYVSYLLDTYSSNSGQ